VKRTSKKTIETLASYGIGCVEPQGTIYVFANVRTDSVKFANLLLEKHSIATVPGRYFGDNAPEWIRITPVAVPEERLCPALETIGKTYKTQH
jgi:aspartate/methionine/tyrosine aminotransferase